MRKSREEAAATRERIVDAAAREFRQSGTNDFRANFWLVRAVLVCRLRHLAVLIGTSLIIRSGLGNDRERFFAVGHGP